MKTARNLLILSLLFIPIAMIPASCSHKHAGAADVWICPMHPNFVSDHQQPCPICGMDLVKKGAGSVKPASTAAHTNVHPAGGFICTMCPEVHSDKPGKCPSCGMKLVPAPASPATSTGAGMSNQAGVPGNASLMLEGRQIQEMGVTFGEAKRRKLSRLVRAVGVISHDTELYGAQQEYLSALRYAKQASPEGRPAAEALLSAAELKLSLMGWTRAQLDALAARGSGEQGLLLSGHHGTAWVRASVFPRDLPFVQVGQTAEVTASSMPGLRLPGVVRSVNTVLDAETRSASVRIELSQSGGVAHEMYVNVAIRSVPVERLSVPEDAVIDSGLRQVVFVAKGSGVFEPREVLVGDLLEDYYVVLGGLAEGERVATGAAFLIDSESRLKSALKRFEAPAP